MTLEEMTAQRDALLAARYCGVRTVEMAGRRVTYATDAEMAAAITDLERRIEAVQEGARKRAVREARTRFVIEPALGSHIFEPDEFHWLRRHRVHAAKHIPHALRLDELLYVLNVRGLHLRNHVNAIAVVDSACQSPLSNFWRRVGVE
jgi:hypothetical protein